MSKPAKIGTTHIYLGGKSDAKNRGMLRDFGITYVLNMTPPRNVDDVAGVMNYFEKEREITYKRCEIFDSTTENIMEHMEGATAFIETAKYHGNILVHCNKGVSRSVSVVVGYLMKYKGMPLAAALAKVRETRPQAQPNDAFMKQLEQYDVQLANERAEEGAGPRPASPKKSKPATPRVSKGPELPPHLQHLMKKGEDEEDEEDEDEEKKEQASSGAVKGPQLPPHLQHLMQQGGKEEEDEPKADESVGAVKGPQLPPHLQHLMQRDDDEEDQSPPKRAKHQ